MSQSGESKSFKQLLTLELDQFIGRVCKLSEDHLVEFEMSRK